MPRIEYRGRVFSPRPDETLLKMFIRQGVEVPYSCGGGVCHICMHRCTAGTVPELASKGLREVYSDNGFFLLCRCIPTGDMQIELPALNMRFIRLEVASLEIAGPGPCRAQLAPLSAFSARAGQFLDLLLPDERRLAVQLLEDCVEGSLFTVVFDECETLAAELMEGRQLEAQGPFDSRPREIEMAEGLDREFPRPDPWLWEQLEGGSRLTDILREFYHRVFRDPILAPYFENATEARLAEKQYNFLRQAITGEKVYFGERPRNAHHWMVIPHAVFDHRAGILHDVLCESGMHSTAVDALMALEEYYRQDIVKNTPWNKVLFGKVLPLEGYETLVLDESTLCDGCGGGVERGEQVIYHVRTGKVYCAACRS